MELSDQEQLRRALMSIVNRIDSGNSTTEPPIVLVVLGQTDSTNNRDKEDGVGIQKPVYGNQISHPSSSQPSSASHPGFEKFQISEPRAAGAPKSCFMEPDRVCVNSGACEMLGH